MSEDELLARLQEVYADALKQAVAEKEAFFQKVQDVQSGKIKPPQYYVDRDEVDKWKQGFLDELARREQIVEDIMKNLNEAGRIASEMISGEMPDIFANARDEQIEALTKECSAAFGFEPSFTTYNRKQIEILMKDADDSPFSKIAYNNLGQNKAVRRRLQNELSVSIMNGESQEKMLKRIQKVTGQSYKQAKRVAQTERTRVQAQGSYEAALEAEAMGIRTYKKWLCAMMPTSRDNHRMLHNACALTKEAFKFSVDGRPVEYPLMYPGDSAAPASQVCNCHCTYVEHVLLDEETVENGKIVQVSENEKNVQIRDPLFQEIKNNYSNDYVGLNSYDFDREVKIDTPKEIENIVNSASDKIVNDFPFLDDYLHLIGYGDSDDKENPATAHIDLSGDFPGLMIAINPDLWKNEKTISEFHRKNQEKGTHIKSEKPESIIAHEYGHIIQYALALKLTGYSGRGIMSMSQKAAFQSAYMMIMDDVKK